MLWIGVHFQVKQYKRSGLSSFFVKPLNGLSQRAHISASDLLCFLQRVDTYASIYLRLARMFYFSCSSLFNSKPEWAGDRLDRILYLYTMSCWILLWRYFIVYFADSSGHNCSRCAHSILRLFWIMVTVNIFPDFIGRNVPFWGMQIFSNPPGMTQIPEAFDESRLLGQSRYVPAISFSNPQDYRSYVISTPDSDFSWRFFGVLRVSTEGSYIFCAQSDDGSVIYINMKLKDDSTLADYTKIINNDGLHASNTVCSDPLPLKSRTYNIMVSECLLKPSRDKLRRNPSSQGRAWYYTFSVTVVKSD